LDIPAIVMADVTQLPALADKEGFVAVFPEGANGTWNTGGAACGLGAFVSNTNDDVAFTQHILDEVEKLQAIDRKHVFMSGFSMGGYGTNNLMCERPDLFRAGAAASGGRTPAPCQGPAPIMLFHGTSDGTIAYDCGVQARAAWALNNGCSTEVDKVQVKGGTCEWSRGCPANGQVVLCSFQGMGHGWAGSVDPFALGGPQFESATALMWGFFKKYL
jgi:polyhydroxybutyrate depolymerase